MKVLLTVSSLFLFNVHLMLCAVAFAQSTATERLETSLKLIDAKDDEYRAVIAISPTAQEEAAAIDQSDGGLLKGMPILIKDNIDMLGLPTTAGSLALLENYPSKDAPSIAQLKQAGGLILGKTNLSEWANFRSEKSSSGWSAVGGQTRNAIDVSRSPCGSSSGSGVAVALGYVDVAIGTETHGSIICPAAANGVVGFKPTHGIISSEGIVPLASSQDTAGPLANSIENASMVLAAMIDPAAKNYSALVEGLQNIEVGADLKGLRLGVMASTLGYDPRRDALFQRAVDKLEGAGVMIVNDIQLQEYDGFWEDNYNLLKYEFKRDLNEYFKGRANPTSEFTLASLIEFNQANAEDELKYFDQGIFELSQALELGEEAYLSIRAKGHKAMRDEGLDKVYDEHKLDGIIGITGGPAWKIDHVNGDAFHGPSMSAYPAIGGYPHVTIAGGEISGLPVGLSFIGKRYEDHKLARIVYGFSQLSE